jgi:hypothetical protein
VYRDTTGIEKLLRIEAVVSAPDAAVWADLVESRGRPEEAELTRATLMPPDCIRLMCGLTPHDPFSWTDDGSGVAEWVEKDFQDLVTYFRDYEDSRGFPRYSISTPRPLIEALYWIDRQEVGFPPQRVVSRDGLDDNYLLMPDLVEAEMWRVGMLAEGHSPVATPTDDGGLIIEGLKFEREMVESFSVDLLQRSRVQSLDRHRYTGPDAADTIAQLAIMTRSE